MKIEKKNPDQFFFFAFEAYKRVKFHFELGTISRKTGDWEKKGCDINTGTLSLVVALFLSCFILSIQQSHSYFRPHSFLPLHTKTTLKLYPFIKVSNR